MRAALGNFPLTAGGLLVLALLAVVFFGPVWAPNNPSHTQGLIVIDGEFKSPPFAPGGDYPWGTDVLGRGTLSLILAGARQTLLLAALAVAARTVVGVALGALAGWTSGSALDRLIGSLAEIVSSFPALLLVMTLILAFGIRRGHAALCDRAVFCRLGRDHAARAQPGDRHPSPEPILRAPSPWERALPASSIRHVLPNLLSSLISIVSLEMGAVMMLLGELGFISIFIGGGTVMARIPGVRVLYSDVPEWGALLSSAALPGAQRALDSALSHARFLSSPSSALTSLARACADWSGKAGSVAKRVFNRYTLGLAIVAVVALRWLTANSGVMPFYRQEAVHFDGKRALEHVAALTDPAMSGRALGTPGLDNAAAYLAGRYRELGLQAAGQEGDLHARAPARL